MPHKVLISLASNFEHEANLSEARRRLSALFLTREYSDAIWTEPVNAKRDGLYLNQLLLASTRLSVKRLSELLKQMEHKMGRTADDRRQGIVRIDLDLLLYDDHRYHEPDWERPYVKKLLCFFGDFKPFS